ncbi:ubiquinone-dependent pyruvate dehydrogenase [Catellatospora tritici]|uniref:ubiquinone-dependent pyruvate dehydrogenase n=1 Tax=Catellatospora tritici TaxID=2851566 RepID=UPI001C2D2AA5|nr:ubiquinone-dependent pyruvate dehydrogenase [Catellatospora tritici]MBV1853509.1 ubiquinone-dependent pyruvate dehydrogenase [Catellatospora tritici]
MARTVADLMVATLKASGVRRVYGVPGDSLNGLTDALRRDGTISWQLMRHEEAAGFAAAGEAAVTGELAVCVGSCGPGNLHLINGLFDANRSRVPVLAIAAQIPRDEIGSGYFQETHPHELFRECSVYSELVTTPSQLPRTLEIAMRTALARSGVAVIVVPGEVFLADAPDGATPVAVRVPAPIVRPDEQSLAAAAAVLNAAERVTILAGAGCAGAHEQLLSVAEALQAPVVHAMRGKEFVEYDNPYDVGMTGLIGFSSGYRAMEHCDALLMLGTDFPYRQFFPEGVPVVQVDVRGEQIGRRVRVDVPLVGTVRDTVDALLPYLTTKTHSAHLHRMLAHYERARRRLDKLTESRVTDSPLHPQYVAAMVSKLAADDAVFTADVGTPCIWAARYLRMNGRRRLLGSFNHGSMANALPQAIGVQAAQPGRQVVTLSGDGGLAMLLGELITLRQQQLPVKVVVFDNGALSFVELEMKAAGIVTYATGLTNPDFAQVAQAVGLFGVRVDSAGELGDALRAAFAHDGPALVDVRTSRQELSLPPKITLAQLKGFTLYATRTILSGNADEIFELAKTNLRELDRE